MLVPLETLIDGMMSTLRMEVLPDVGSRFARGQLHCVLDVLNNLRDRIEEKAALHEADADAAAEALAEVALRLREGGRTEEAANVEHAAAAAPMAPAAERAAALRRALVVTLDALESLPPAAREVAHAALRSYLVPQAVRDIAFLKPSLLGEISKG